MSAQAATIAQMQTTLKVKLVGKISSGGATVEVTGPAGESVTVTATCKKSDKKTGLTAGALGKASGKLDASGKAQLKIKLGSKAKKALKKAKGSKVSFSAVLTNASATRLGQDLVNPQAGSAGPHGPALRPRHAEREERCEIRFIPWLAVALALMAIPATTALAHTEVSSTSPKRGGKAKTSIRSVKVTFNQQIRSGSIRVTGPGGKVVSAGKGGRDPRNVKRLVVSLKGGLKAGKYKARWTIKAVDGHTQKGSFSFRLRR